MIPVGIVTTQKRINVCEDTLKSLGSEVPIKIFRDLKPGIWANHVASWEALFSDGAERALLLQDDVRACKNWYLTTELLAEKFPRSCMISLFNPFYNGDPTNGKGYIRSTSPWEQALIIRRGFYKTFQKWITPERLQKRAVGKRPGDFWHDSLICDFLEDIKQEAILIYPPVFQHTNEESTMSNPRNSKWGNRQCATWPGESFDALEYFTNVWK